MVYGSGFAISVHYFQNVIGTDLSNGFEKTYFKCDFSTGGFD